MTFIITDRGAVIMFVPHLIDKSKPSPYSNSNSLIVLLVNFSP